MPEERDLELAVMRLAWRIDALDSWRRDEVDAKLSDLERRVGSLTRADEIAEAVADKLREEHTDTVTFGNYRVQRWQARIAAWSLLVAVAVAVAGGVKALIGA